MAVFKTSGVALAGRARGCDLLNENRNLAFDAFELADNALRTCQDRKRVLDERVAQVMVVLDLDDKKRSFPEELKKTFCDLARIPLSDCHWFQERVAKIKEEIFAAELAGKIMDQTARAAFVAQRLDIGETLTELIKEKEQLEKETKELSRKYISAEARIRNFEELWKEWDSLTLVTSESGPKDKQTLAGPQLELRRLEADLQHKQLDSAPVYERLSGLYDALCSSILGPPYRGEVDYPPTAKFAFSIRSFNRKGKGAAVTTLGNHLADVTALIWAASGEGFHPGLLIHDSPREADMTEPLYDAYLKGIYQLSEELGGENAPFQYIISTTTPPPKELASAIRVTLAGYPEDQLLFKQRLGKVGELALE